MKKGFILALLMVAMVALVLPVAARAPIVNMPTVIIGDSDPADLEGGLGIMRYLNAVNLKNPAIVDWNNDDTFTSDLFHAYIFNPQTLTGAANPDVVAANPTRLIEPLTSATYGSLIATGAMPPAINNITSYTSAVNQFFWLSLLDTTRNPAVTNAYTADPGVEGVAPDASYNKSVDMVFVAGVTSGTALVKTTATLAVICQSTGTDSTSVGRIDKSYGFTGSLDGWTYSSSTPTYPAAPQFTSATSIGFALTTAPTSGVTFATWKSPFEISGSSATAGRVYRAVAKLQSDSASSDACPGWRLTFLNGGSSHYGKVNIQTKGTQAAGEANTPYAAHPFDAKIFWAVPTELGDFGDAEGQALFAGIPGTLPPDMRKYQVSFDCLATVGDLGTIQMDQMVIASFPRPADVTPVLAWGNGVGEVPYNAPVAQGGFVKGASVTSPNVFVDGNAIPAANSLTLNLTNGATGRRFIVAQSQGYTASAPAVPVQQLAPVSGHLYRFSFGLTCVSNLAVPCYRININGSDLVPGVSLTNRNMAWAQYMAYSDMVTTASKQPFSKLTGQTVCPGAPNLASDPAGPSVIDTYVFAHTVAAQSGSSFHNIYPLLSAVDKGGFGGAGTVWPDATTNLVFTNAGWEDLGTDF